MTRLSALRVGWHVYPALRHVKPSLDTCTQSLSLTHIRTHNSWCEQVALISTHTHTHTHIYLSTMRSPQLTQADSLTVALTHSLTHPLTHSLTPSHSHPVTHSLTPSHSLFTHSQSHLAANGFPQPRPQSSSGSHAARARDRQRHENGARDQASLSGSDEATPSPSSSSSSSASFGTQRLNFTPVSYHLQATGQTEQSHST